MPSFLNAVLLVAATMSQMLVRAANHENRFLFPDTLGEVYSNGYVMDVQWVSNFTDPTLTMWCRRPNEQEVLKKYESSTNVPSFNGTKAVTIDLVNIETCWFMLSAEGGHGFNSNAWKLANNGNAVVSSATGTFVTSAPTASSIGAPSTSSAASPTSDSLSAATSGTDLSPAAKGGLAAGIVVAALFFIAGLAFFIIARRKFKAAQDLQDGGAYMTQAQFERGDPDSEAPLSSSHDGNTVFGGRRGGSMYRAGSRMASTHITGKTRSIVEIVSPLTPGSEVAHYQRLHEQTPQQQEQQSHGIWSQLEQRQYPEMASRVTGPVDMGTGFYHEIPSPSTSDSREVQPRQGYR